MLSMLTPYEHAREPWLYFAKSYDDCDGVHLYDRTSDLVGCLVLIHPSVHRVIPSAAVFGNKMIRRDRCGSFLLGAKPEDPLAPSTACANSAMHTRRDLDLDVLAQRNAADMCVHTK